jgi:hypothetical protein
MTAKSEYAKLEEGRHSYINRGRDCAKLTIPSLLPEAGSNSSSVFRTPHQSVGARGVTNLSSALLLSLLPPNQPFFRLVLDEAAVMEVAQVPGAKAELDGALASIERAVMKEIEVNSFRVGLSEALKQLIVTGNALLHIPEKGGMRVFRLDRYVVERDPMGNLIKAITKEDVAPDALPPKVKELVESYGNTSEKETCELYTHAKWEGGKIHVHQEILDKVIPGSEGTHAAARSPFLALRFISEQGSAYGRSYVEEYYGDLNSLEGLSRAIVEGSAAAAKVLFMCSPNGATRPRDIARSENGEIISGMASDVTVLQMNKFNDFRVTLETMNIISERLNFAFMLTEGAIRQAERVTAEEVRVVSQAVERSLGGLYSVLAQEFQLPLVNRLMDRMTKSGRLPRVPEKYVSPAVTTGVDGLGRTMDLNRLDTFVGGLLQIMGPEGAAHVNWSEYLRRRAASLSIDTAGLVKTEQELAEEAQQAQQAAMMQATVPGMATAATGGAVKGLAQQSAAAAEEELPPEEA